MWVKTGHHLIVVDRTPRHLIHMSLQRHGTCGRVGLPGCRRLPPHRWPCPPESTARRHALLTSPKGGQRMRLPRRGHREAGTNVGDPL